VSFSKVLAARVSTTHLGDANTEVRAARFSEDHIVIQQECLGNRAFLNEDDMVVLDIPTQQALYEILKKRFGY
jgi:hypothetical protein